MNLIKKFGKPFVFYSKYSTYILLFLSILSIIAFFSLASIRFSYKLNNGPFEDSTLQQAYRIIEGKQIYANPTIDYVPLLYGPVLFYASALCIKLFGLHLSSIRVMPILANIGIVIGCFFVFNQLLKGQRKKSFLLSMIAVGLFYSINSFSMFWLDIAKVDSIFIFGMSVFLYCSFRYLKERKLYLIFILSALSVFLIFTKQVALISTLAFFVYLIFARTYLHAISYGISFLLLFGISSGILYVKEGSNFFLYNFVIPGTHPYFLKSPLEDIAFLTPSILITLSSIGYLLFPISKLKEKLTVNRNKFLFTKKVFLIYFTGVFLVVSYLGRSKAGAAENSWLYFYFYASILAIYSFYVASIILSRLGSKKLLFTLLTLIVTQFACFAYNPIKVAMLQRDKIAVQDNFIKSYCSMPQPVLNPEAPFYSQLFCNSRASFLLDSTTDILYHEKLFSEFVISYQKSLNNKEYKTVMMFESYTKQYIDGLIKLINAQAAASKTGKPNLSQRNFLQALELHNLVHENYRIVDKKDYTSEEDFIQRSTLKYSFYRPLK